MVPYLGKRLGVGSVPRAGNGPLRGVGRTERRGGSVPKGVGEGPAAETRGSRPARCGATDPSALPDVEGH